MRRTATEIVEYANRISGGLITVHQHVQDIRLPSGHEDDLAELAARVQALSEEAHDVFMALEESLTDGEFTPEERVRVAGEVVDFKTRVSQLATFVQARMQGASIRDRLTGPAAQLVPVFNALALANRSMDWLLSMIADYLDPEPPSDPGPEPEPPKDFGPKGVNPHPGGDVSVPDGVNPIAHQMANTEPEEGVINIMLPAGRIPGALIGDHGWDKLPRVVPPPGLEVKVFGHPDGTTIRHNGEKWGRSLGVEPGGGWSGRVAFYDLTIECSGDHGFSGGAYGSAQKRPLEDVRLYRCTIVDGPHRCKQPVSANQMRLGLYGCFHDTPDAWEHTVYLRNCLGFEMIECRSVACGGQVWQQVSRPSEGPQYPRDRIIIRENELHNFHRDPSRAGSGLTLAGAGHDLYVEANVVYDVLEDEDRDHAYGLSACWNGGHGNYHPLQSGKANGEVFYRGNVFVSVKPNRSPFKIHHAESAHVEGNVFLVAGPHPRTLDLHDGFPVTWRGNNDPEHVQKVKADPRFSDLELVEPKVRLIDQGKILEPASEDFEIKG